MSSSEEEAEAREKKVPVEDFGEMGEWVTRGDDRGGVFGRERDRLCLAIGGLGWDWVDKGVCGKGLGRGWSACGCDWVRRSGLPSLGGERGGWTSSDGGGETVTCGTLLEFWDADMALSVNVT